MDAEFYSGVVTYNTKPSTYKEITNLSSIFLHSKHNSYTQIIIWCFMSIVIWCLFFSHLYSRWIPLIKFMIWFS